MSLCGGDSSFEKERNSNKKLSTFKKQIFDDSKCSAELKSKFESYIYNKSLGNTLRFFRTLAQINQDSMSQLLGLNSTEYTDIEDGVKEDGINFMIVDKFCFIVEISLNDFYKKLQHIRHIND